MSDTNDRRTDEITPVDIVERLRGPLPSVYVPFGDEGELAWDGVLSRNRQMRERSEAADEIDRLRRVVDEVVRHRDEITPVDIVERLRGPLPSVYVPFGDEGELAWDGVLSRNRQMRERSEAADEIDRLRRVVDEVVRHRDEIAPFREHCWCWMNAEEACCECGDDSEGEGHLARCRSTMSRCLHDVREPLTIWAYQLRRPDHWVDIATFDNYEEALRCGINTVRGRVRIVRRVMTETVLP